MNIYRFIGIFLEVGLGILMGVPIWQDYKHQEGEGRDRWVEPYGKRVIHWIDRIKGPSHRNKGYGIRKSRVYRSMIDLFGEEAGLAEYQRYRYQRAGLVIGALFLGMGILLLSGSLEPKEDKGMLLSLERPVYGQGNRTEKVTVTIQGEEESYEQLVTITIPQQELTYEEKVRLVQEMLRAVATEYDGKVVIRDLTFPTSLQGVALQFQSRSPEIIRSDGKLLQSPGEKRQAVLFRVTGSMGEVHVTQEVTIWIAADTEMNLTEKAGALKSEIDAGKYLSGETMELPSVLPTGERLRWEKADSTERWLPVLLLVFLPILALVKQAGDYRRIGKVRQQEIARYFPTFLGELRILMGAGSSLQNAWMRISRDYEKEQAGGKKKNPWMEEVRKVTLEMEEGSSMREALDLLADRVHQKEVRRFCALLTQSLRRGDRYLLDRLQEMTEEAWETRKKEVREKAQEADTKLLVPLVMMLVVVLVIVLTPAMMTIGG